MYRDLALAASSASAHGLVPLPDYPLPYLLLYSLHTYTHTGACTPLARAVRLAHDRPCTNARWVPVGLPPAARSTVATRCCSLALARRCRHRPAGASLDRSAATAATAAAKLHAAVAAILAVNLRVPVRIER